jgi:hypothetical protein
MMEAAPKLLPHASGLVGRVANKQICTLFLREGAERRRDKYQLGDLVFMLL